MCECIRGRGDSTLPLIKTSKGVSTEESTGTRSSAEDRSIGALGWALETRGSFSFKQIERLVLANPGEACTKADTAHPGSPVYARLSTGLSARQGLRPHKV